MQTYDVYVFVNTVTLEPFEISPLIFYYLSYEFEQWLHSVALWHTGGDLTFLMFWLSRSSCGEI